MFKLCQIVLEYNVLKIQRDKEQEIVPGNCDVMDKVVKLNVECVPCMLFGRLG